MANRQFYLWGVEDGGRKFGHRYVVASTPTAALRAWEEWARGVVEEALEFEGFGSVTVSFVQHIPGVSVLE